MIDCAAYIGQYPFRHLPHPDPDILVRVLERENLSEAWVGYLPSAWHRDPAPGNDALFTALAPYRQVLRPAPVVRPAWPLWERTLRDLARLAERHPRVAFILAHLGGGGDWAHTAPAIRDVPNVYPDLSGSGVDRGMLDLALSVLGARRLLWACDLTMETGLAKLRALDAIGLSVAEIADIRWRNAARLFPRGAFPRCEGVETAASAAVA